MKTLKIIVLLLLGICTLGKLVYLTELYRHGARYPVNDYYDGKETKPFHGQLTGIGMRQHYLLGSYLRQDYLEQLGLRSSFDPTQVQVFVDGSQRCLESAYAHMAGWFPLGEGEQIPKGLDPSLLDPPFQTSNLNQASTIQQPALTSGYQPIPIKIEKAFFPGCPNEKQIFEKRIEIIAPIAAALETEQTLFIRKIKDIFNLTFQQSNLAGILELYDTLECDKNLGRAIPSKLTQDQFQQMKYLQHYLFVLLYAEHLAKVYATPIMRSVLDKMDMVIEGKLGRKKLTVYSAHDSNVAPILTFLNLTTAQCLKKQHKNQTVTGNCAEPVPFASSIQWQLHIRESTSQMEVDPLQISNYYVKVKYNGKYYELCQSKATQCDYLEFSKRVSTDMVDYDKECGVK